MSEMKKAMIVASAVLLCGCAGTANVMKSRDVTGKQTANINEDEVMQTYSYIDEISSSDIEPMPIAIELAQEYTPSKMLNDSDDVVLAYVSSLTGASMEYNGVVGYTYGKMKVVKNLYGKLEEGAEIDFAKPGCVISFTEWEAAQPDEAKAKRAFLRKENDGMNTPKYYDLLIENDIHIEPEKTYLVYLKYNQGMSKYEVVGLENGLRETNISYKAKTVANDATKDVTIKNNTTMQNESLDDYISKYIPD
jgi:hypothetical protein